MIRRSARISSRRRGVTLLELLASSSIMAMLMLGIGSILYVSMQTFDSRDSVVIQRATSGEIVGDLADDLRHAIKFTTRTSTAVTFTVPDRTGDELPDTVSYSWSGTAGDPLLYSFNGATPATIADDVHQFDLEYISTYMLGLKTPPMAGSSVLFVVSNPGSLTSREAERKSLLENWGYEVSLIDDGDNQASFDAAFVNNDVVYVSHDVDHESLGNKVKMATIGVVTEHGKLTETLGFADEEAATIEKRWIKILYDNHYITTDYPYDTKVFVLTSNHDLEVVDPENSGTANLNLARTNDDGNSHRSMITLSPGDDLAGGGEAAGRRVHLPWGAAATASFTGDGLYLLKRAIEWGAGAGENSPLHDTLMVVVDPLTLTNPEQQRKALLEDMGYRVDLIASTASQSAFNTAIADTDVVFVPCHSTELDLDFGTLNSNQTISTNGTTSAANGVTVNAKVQAFGSISGGTYNGVNTPGYPKRDLPDTSSVFDYYNSNGQQIPVTSLPTVGAQRFLEEVLLSPESNPFGATNEEGVYVIHCHGDPLVIRNCRIVGTLVVIDCGQNSCIEGSICMEPALDYFPSLLVKDSFDFKFTQTNLEESSFGVNFNPVSTPFPYLNGAGNNDDTDYTDSYPSRITGLVYVRNKLKIPGGAPTFHGCVVTGGEFELQSATVTLKYRGLWSKFPPPGFTVGDTMDISAGTWRRETP